MFSRVRDSVLNEETTQFGNIAKMVTDSLYSLFNDILIKFIQIIVFVWSE